MGQFSITLPIFWVTGKIENDDLVKAYWIFEYGASPKAKDKKVQFLINRLSSLKIIQQGYINHDATLPK